jgi:hypothetical protein
MTRHQKSRIICMSSSGRIEGVISLSDIVQLDEEGGAQARLAGKPSGRGAVVTDHLKEKGPRCGPFFADSLHISRSGGCAVLKL